ncbi:hypothetical protein [Microvirga sp. VF16]|uniref:DUF6894 family protein n=1 Tax=Microvirga sp. VF16 TaxID=2807101 RepID=UPI00193CCB3A|nr:hypothetical protein [Microvirga sp. VF16]QRM32716.1 hypothetical protein JO965_32120 [Microvirga sp. VF16]
MPRYYFDIRYDEGAWSVDPDGMDLIHPTDARRQAVMTAAERAKDAEGRHRRISVRIRDSHPEPLLTVNVPVAAKIRDLEPA